MAKCTSVSIYPKSLRVFISVQGPPRPIPLSPKRAVGTGLEVVKRQAFSSCLTSPEESSPEHQKKPRKRIALSNPFRHLLLGCIASLLSWPQRKLWPLALVRGAKPPFNPLIGCADLGPAPNPAGGTPP